MPGWKVLCLVLWQPDLQSAPAIEDRASGEPGPSSEAGPSNS